MAYRFYGWQQAVVPAKTHEYKGIHTPLDLYDALQNLWTSETCSPTLRAQWSEQNKTLGQCSITAFLVQDIFGGEVYGVLLPSGGVHCYNVVDGHLFDLTSEQFGDKVCNYVGNPVQTREEHFANEDKYQRYLLLRRSLQEYCRTL